MTYELPPLSYALEELQPAISANTLQFHWGKHLATYISNLNNLIQNNEYQDMELDDIIRKSSGPLFNNAAQTYNHIFFFKSLSPKPQLQPTGKLLTAIEKEFGSLDSFKEQINKAAISLFGSGWAWLCVDENGKLEILALPNAGNPLTMGKKPLIAIDVWEHSYYLDYQNRRADYIAGFWKVLDWKSAELLF